MVKKSKKIDKKNSKLSPKTISTIESKNITETEKPQKSAPEVKEPCTEDISTIQSKNIPETEQTQKSVPVVKEPCTESKVNKKFSKPNVKQEQENVCPICSKVFLQTKYFKEHVKRHDPSFRKPPKGNRLLCDLCGKTLINITELKIHIRSHKNIMKSCCEICGKSFLRVSTLNRHVRTVHSTERNFICSICGKAFSAKCALKRHERSHSDPSTHFPCSYCDKKFALKCVLLEHEMTHMPFRSKAFKCDECTAKFFKSYLLKQHKRTHTNEKPYVCRCGKSFSQKGNLSIHEKTHEGFKKFPCTKCEKGFTRAEYLQRHEKEWHSETPGVVKKNNKRISKTKKKSTASLRTKLSVVRKSRSDEGKKKPNKDVSTKQIAVVLADEEAAKDEFYADVPNVVKEPESQNMCIVKENVDEEPIKKEESNEAEDLKMRGKTNNEDTVADGVKETTIDDWIMSMN